MNPTGVWYHSRASQIRQSWSEAFSTNSTTAKPQSDTNGDYLGLDHCLALGIDLRALPPLHPSV
jgi:hypothetical protein